jgi:SAM-dependent methyltransferase
MKKNLEDEKLKCTVCGAVSILEHSFSDLNLYRCPDCDHCFSYLFDNFEDYGSEYFDETHQNWFNNPKTPLMELYTKFISNRKHNASVLDAGCGKGDFLRYLHSKSPELSLTGIDFFLNSPVEGIEFLQGDIFSMDINRQFDVVVSIVVIEHIADVQMFIKRIKKLCSPGGLIIITTINDRSLLYDVSRLLYRFGYKTPLERLYNRHHVNHFNITSLKHLLENNGLSLKKTFLHNFSVDAVDIPAQSPVVHAVLRYGVWGIFTVSQIIGRTYLQTVVCQNGDFTPEEI